MVLNNASQNQMPNTARDEAEEKEINIIFLMTKAYEVNQVVRITGNLSLTKINLSWDLLQEEPPCKDLNVARDTCF